MSGEKGKFSSGGECSGMWTSTWIEEKGGRNKRKFLSHLPPEVHDKIPTTLELLAELGAFPPDDYRAICNMCECSQDNADALKSELSGLSEFEAVPAIGDSDYYVIPDADWSDFTESQLEELCLNNLDTIFKSAIKIVVASGYSEDVVAKAMLRSDLCYGSKDPVLNIVDNTLAVLESEKEIDVSRDPLFENLEQLEKYTLAEMVCVLREVNTFFNTGDAMWCLLICDMNVSHACAMDGDYLSFLGSNEATGDSSSVSLASELSSKANSNEENHPNAASSNPPGAIPNSRKSELPAAKGTPDLRNQTKPIACEGKPPEKSAQMSASNNTKRTLSVIEEHVQAKTQSSGSVEKPVSCKKGHPGGPKTILRQKIHMEKNYRGSWRSGKLSSFGGMIFDKKMKSVSDSIGMHPKNAAMKIKRSMEVSIAHAQGEGHLSLSVGTSISSASNKKTTSIPPVLPKENTEPSLPSKNNACSNFTTLCDVASDIIHNKRTANTSPVLPKVNPAPTMHPESNVASKPTSSSKMTPDDSCYKESVNTQPISTKANCEPSLSLLSESNAASNVTPTRETISDLSHLGVSYDETTGRWVPHDKLDEVILKMAARARDLENQLGQWTDWANQKVIQATRRLNKDKAELKSLRQEKEEVKGIQKERQSVEDNTMRKLSEMENALSRATDQVEKADAAVSRLEMENSKLRQVMEEAKKRSSEATASYKEVSKREDNIAKKLQSSESQKTSLQEELAMLKRKRIQLEHDVDQAQKFLNQAEARQKQVKKEKDGILAQVEKMRKETEQLEISAKLVEDTVRTKSENDLQRLKDRIHDLEFQVIQLTLKTDPSKMAALHWSTDGNYSSSLTNGKIAQAIKGTNQTSYASKLKAIFQENLQNKLVKRDRECVMCLTEEMSVVFLPCAHQVVCTKCNELHKKQGMKDCPSCRTPIKQRICARFYSSSN